MAIPDVADNIGWWLGVGVLVVSIMYGGAVVAWAAILASGRMDGRKSANEVNQH